MRKITAILCLLVVFVCSAQYSEPGFYRVHNVNSDGYICIKDTAYKKLTTPAAFWPCVVMLTDSAQVSDPGSIIYIPGLTQTSLYAQGVSTYLMTGLLMDVEESIVREGDRDTYVAITVAMIQGRPFTCYFRDEGKGMTAGSSDQYSARWWIEPVNEASMDTSYLGVKPANETIVDAEGWYWTTMCVDFPMLLPLEGGVEGAYTVQEIKLGEDGNYHAAAVKICQQGEIVPAATPVLLKCKASYASGNKVVPVGEIANNMTFPLVNGLLHGGYFSVFNNYCNMNGQRKDYVPVQAVEATAYNLALGVDENGVLGFFPKEEGTYMDANSAWLSIEGMEDMEGVSAIYLDVVPAEEVPEVIEGDVNGDGTLNVKDLTWLIDYLIGDEEASVESSNEASATGMSTTVDDSLAADIDGNGVVNVKDVTALIDLLLSRE